MDVKNPKLANQEDRISDLPDAIIHYILSFLPSTKEVIRTTILSKRWQNQWTRVPVLIFESPTSGMFPNQSNLNFIRLINNALALYDCSKIKKIQFGYNFEYDPDFISKILFATTKNVEELILTSGGDCYQLPGFLLENSSLVELQMFYCCFRLDFSINWRSLKVLKIDGWSSLWRPSIGMLVSGCPLLELLEFRNSGREEMNKADDVISSKSLKTLILADIQIDNHMQISCPNLTMLFICPNSSFNLVEKSIEISCPKLESVDLYDSSNKTYKLVNCLSLVYANLDFEIHSKNVAKESLEQIQHVKELKVRSWIIEVLSDLEMEGLSYQMLNNKVLTLHVTSYEHFPEIICALHSSPSLERLVIKLPVFVGRITADLSNLYEPYWNLNDCGENYWNSNETDFNSLVSHLRFVKIVGLNKREAKSKLVINFIEFLLKNASALEKLVVMVSKGQADFQFKVSQKVSSFPKCYRHTVVSVLCTERSYGY